MVKSPKISTQVFFVILIILSSKVLAQSTIFNIPTTDTVTKGKVYAELDFLPEVPGTDVSRTYEYNPRFVIGAPGKIEFGVNFPTYNTRSSSASETSAYIQPNAKWRFFENEREGISAAVGGIINTPLNNRDAQDSWGYLYGLISKKVKTGDYGPRFHGGFYGVIWANQNPDKGPVSFFGPRDGAILGYEQPISKKVSFVADWFSGKNNLGYFTPGISITLPANGLLNAGYSIGNDSWADSNATKNRYAFLYYGVTF